MKTWLDAVIEEINFEKTEDGRSEKLDNDRQYTDGRGLAIQLGGHLS
ncbi:hypothetical protein [Butyrivibrio sp. YAB3001]|nr:hypothetical protein [Butyrivibrio sp. YAB3001]SFB84148.1 hypothetical protein SAMN02910398_00831 [Butyrivibrio sp. YAB3001]